MAGVFPRLIVVKSFYFPAQGHANYKDDGSVALGEQEVLSTRVKIAVERATINPSYIHLRFSGSNRYWSRSSVSTSIVAETMQPNEDTGHPGCTLFEPVQVNGNTYMLRHVSTGGTVRHNTSGSFGLFVNPSAGGSLDFDRYFTVIDWDTLVKLPSRVAFKGYNDSYVGGIWADNRPFLQLSASDPNERKCGYRIDTMPDGHVRVYSDLFSRFWRRDWNWILADNSDAGPTNANTVYWPVKIDEGTIALRSNGNGNFCKSHADQGFNRCLNAQLPQITQEARLRVEELVMQRSIYDVRYRMEDARLHGETPYVAGTTQLTNDGDAEASMAVSITYEDSKSYTFSRGFSLTLGVSTTFKAGIVFFASAEYTVSFEISGNFQWDTTTTVTTTISATGSVLVPARTRATIEYVATRATCDIPYSYTQQDRSSTDGRILYSHFDDGTYTGVSCYNYHFVVREAQSL